MDYAFLNDLISPIKDYNFLGVMIFWNVVLGASLIPDLDNQDSTAGYQLGILGKIITMFAVMTSGVIYGISRTGKDTCKSQHRMFWHTPLSVIISIILALFFTPKSDVTIFEYIRAVYESKSFINS